MPELHLAHECGTTSFCFATRRKNYAAFFKYCDALQRLAHIPGSEGRVRAPGEERERPGGPSRKNGSTSFCVTLPCCNVHVALSKEGAVQHSRPGRARPPTVGQEAGPTGFTPTRGTNQGACTRKHRNGRIAPGEWHLLAAPAGWCVVRKGGCAVAIHRQIGQPPLHSSALQRPICEWM